MTTTTPTTRKFTNPLHQWLAPLNRIHASNRWAIVAAFVALVVIASGGTEAVIRMVIS